MSDLSIYARLLYFFNIEPRKIRCAACGKKPTIRTQFCENYQPPYSRKLHNIIFSENIQPGQSFYVTLIGCERCKRIIGFAAPERKPSRFDAIGHWNDQECFWYR